MRDSVKLVHAALDDDNGDIVVRGVIDPVSLNHLKVADYQREILPLAKIRDLAAAFKVGKTVPDIDLGMRGGQFLERDGAFYLQNDVYIIDGLQRRAGAIEALKAGVVPRLGAMVHFNTTEEWERQRFRLLNIARTRLSPNVLLRNLRKENESIEMLYNLTMDTGFVLGRKVNWSQRMKREELISALIFLKTMSRLHDHFGTGLRDTNHELLATALDRVMTKIGRNSVRLNTVTFWNLVDECWGVRTVHFKEGAVHLRSTFLFCLAALLGNHATFWKDSKLFVEKDLLRKIALFPITDPQVMNLSSASGQARELLYQLLLEHVNSGKRTKRLIPFRKLVRTQDAEVTVTVDETKTAEAVM